MTFTRWHRPHCLAPRHRCKRRRLDCQPCWHLCRTQALQTSQARLVATLGAFTIAEGANVNAYVNRINQAEQGRIFVDRAGVLVMQPRIGTTLDAPTATFNDTGTAIPYDGVGVEYDQQLIINTATD
jgi:hypothetical protein